jgi:hypothetical protein
MGIHWVIAYRGISGTGYSIPEGLDSLVLWGTQDGPTTMIHMEE